MSGARTVLLSAVLALGVAAGATVALSALSGSASSDAKLGAKLLARDPGARIGANTIVSTDDGGELLSVPDRPNFVLALGDNETIHSGARNDQLGALGDGDTIIVRGSHELIVGGPEGKIIVAGPGHDLVVERYPDATIVLESPDNEVIVSGRGDRVECLHGATDEEIDAAPSTTVDKDCRSHHNILRRFASTRAPALAAGGPTAYCADPSNRGFGKFAHPCPVVGEGSNSNPYSVKTSACPPEDDPEEPAAGCTVEFPARELDGLWADEYIPAYRCPDVKPYLGNSDYAPFGTRLPGGVDVSGLGPVGVSISGSSTTTAPHTGVVKRTGTLTGYPHSSATNWTGGRNSYRVILHCDWWQRN